MEPTKINIGCKRCGHTLGTVGIRVQLQADYVCASAAALSGNARLVHLDPADLEYHQETHDRIECDHRIQQDKERAALIQRSTPYFDLPIPADLSAKRARRFHRARIPG